MPCAVCKGKELGGWEALPCMLSGRVSQIRSILKSGTFKFEMQFSQVKWNYTEKLTLGSFLAILECIKSIIKHLIPIFFLPSVHIMPKPALIRAFDGTKKMQK